MPARSVVSGNRVAVPSVSTGMALCTMEGGSVYKPSHGRRILSGFLLPCLCFIQVLRAADRITLAVNDNRRVSLRGQISPRIKASVDQGTVDPSMELAYVTLVLKPSAGQQADLDQLLQQQQNPASPDYHRWLTPEQYADRFGVSQSDIAQIVAWLGQHGLTLKSVARARNAVSFGGTAGQMQAAFGTEIHHYLAGGELHYANSTEPTLPAAFQGVTLAIQGLHDFRLKPMLKLKAHSGPLRPRETMSDGTHVLGPDDIATIYDITPLYNAGIDGAGQKLAVVGQTDIQMSDIEGYRTSFSLPGKDPTKVLVKGDANPGINQNDLAEADLDLELAGAVARKATIYYVYSSNVLDSFQYAIDQNQAPLISISYGGCEVQTSSSDAATFESWGKQANAQGITIFAASGDSGGADCFDPTDRSTTDGNTSLSVDLPAGLPEVTGIGGTEFSEGSGSYWNLKNTASNASALSYIPETSWNDSNIDGSPSASGGGASMYFSKPSWQSASGVPDDGARDVPDVSVSGSADHDGYNIMTGGSLQIIGGTSAGPPQFAGIAALLGQYLVANGYQATQELGNMNPGFYALAPATGVYHDITTGNNKVAPCASQRNCTLSAIGYDAGVGYDPVTGLGSVDVYNLVTSWHSSVASKSSSSVTLSSARSSLAFTDTTVLTATVSGAGVTPTGEVIFSTASSTLGTAALNASGAASLTIGGILLAAGANSISAQYEGDNTYFGANGSVSVTITSPATGPPSVKSLVNGAAFTQALAPGGVLSIFGSQLAPATGGAPSIPLPMMMAGTVVTINGIPAALYYVSPGQLNVQIPYEVPAGSAAVLRVNNNGESVFTNFKVTATAPEIFAMNSQGTGQGAILNTSYQLADASHPATPGSTYILIYCTGLGAVSHQPADGTASPLSPLAETPTPQVTIGGVAATVNFSGLAPGFVGEYQVDALVPASVAAGSAVPVTVSLGGATSNTVTIAVGP